MYITSVIRGSRLAIPSHSIIPALIHHSIRCNMPHPTETEISSDCDSGPESAELLTDSEPDSVEFLTDGKLLLVAINGLEEQLMYI